MSEAPLVQASQVDNWQINAAVHYNEWADLQKGDFAPVASAYRALTLAFSCDQCGAILNAVAGPSGIDTLRCACGGINLNLTKKKV